MILQLNPPLPMDTARGAGLAHFMIDYGPEEHLMWVVFMDADGACWTVPNPEVRMQANWSMGRRPPSKPFARPAPIIAPPVDGVPAPMNGAPAHGAALNGHAGANGSVNGVRYDAAPAA